MGTKKQVWGTCSHSQEQEVSGPSKNCTFRLYKSLSQSCENKLKSEHGKI